MLRCIAFLCAALPFGIARAEPVNPITALERAPVVVIATFESVNPLAHSAHLGHLVVEEVVVGSAASPESIDVVWEEPGLTVPPRFGRGDRVLIGLDALPTASIWRQRIPDADARAHTFAIAGEGAASVARPTTAVVEILRHHLLLDPAARRGDAGLVRLAQLTNVGDPRLAKAALVRITQIHAARSTPLPDVAATALVQALLRRDAPGLDVALIDWIESARPAELLPPLEAAIEAAGPSGGPITLHAAHAALTGSLDPELAAAFARSGDVDARILACRHATGDRARALLPALIVSDPSEHVRAMAVERWAIVAGAHALPEIMRALEDPSVVVRRAAAQAVADVGEPALPDLLALVDSGSSDGARMAIAALSMMGEPAQPALQQIAAEQEDEGLRTLARIALGLPIGHDH